MNRKCIVLVALAVALLPLAAWAAPLDGSFSGAFDGGEGTVKITGAPPRYQVTIQVGADGCAGGVDGPAMVDARGRLVMVARPSPGEQACRVTLTPAGAGWDVANDGNCGFYHGASCDFSGAVKPDRPSARPAHARAPHRP